MGLRYGGGFSNAVQFLSVEALQIQVLKQLPTALQRTPKLRYALSVLDFLPGHSVPPRHPRLGNKRSRSEAAYPRYPTTPIEFPQWDLK